MSHFMFFGEFLATKNEEIIVNILKIALNVFNYILPILMACKTGISLKVFAVAKSMVYILFFIVEI